MQAHRTIRNTPVERSAEPGSGFGEHSRLGLPELLSPAGDWECARAAVENGADAIYFGLEHHNARMRANNFTTADLPALMEYLHRRGVKGYVTFNTLIFAGEMAEAEAALRTIIGAGVDAAIVQDVGICRLIRRLSSDFPIHASTQMTVTSAAGVQFAREIGCSLVVLARECSVREIEMIQAAQAAPGSVLLEVFIHGALCVAYSGQCLTSEALGGRSANRGVCAQACRMPHELVSDGALVPLGERRYLLSPRDLAGLELLPELFRAGVASLKIEGRLKSPEYVANITRVYRQALDRLAGRPLTDPPSRLQPDDATRYEMEMAFSRGLHTGWLGGVNNQELVHARFGKKRGVWLGAISQVQGQRVGVRLQGPLKLGDGVVFDAGRPDEPEQGGRVYEIEQPPARASGPARSEPAEVFLSFGHGDIDFRRVQVGDNLWKTSDPELDRRLRQTYAGTQPRFQRPIALRVQGVAGQPLRLTARDEGGHTVELTSAIALAAARTQPLTRERLGEQLGRLGGTPFRLARLEVELESETILPVSELNRLRREMVGRLESLRAQPARWQLTEGRAAVSPLRDSGSAQGRAAARPSATPELIALVRTVPQLEAAVDSGITRLYCEFEDPKKYREAVAQFRSWPAGPSAPSRELFVAPPRITKPGEEWILKQVRSCEADGYLVRNYDHLEFFRGCRCVGDYSLNVANGLSAEYFLDRFGLERLTASYDLNAAQLEALLQSTPPAWFEITIHQHMPMFHMEHCLFCAFLSQGTDYTNCGRPCDHHDVRLRDRVGIDHFLKADAGCRNTVFHALAQTGAESVARFLGLGARHFRVEFMNESPEEVRRTLARYGQLLRGEISGAHLWRELKLLSQLGVTRGPSRNAER